MEKIKQNLLSGKQGFTMSGSGGEGNGSLFLLKEPAWEKIEIDYNGLAIVEKKGQIIADRDAIQD